MNIQINEKLKDFLTFKRLITPMLIQAFFWAALVLTITSAVTYAIRQNFLTALLTLVFGPIFLRAICETMIVLFNINESLKSLKEKNIEKK